MRQIVFPLEWMRKPRNHPDQPAITSLDWGAYKDALGGATLWMVLASVVVICFLYWVTVRGRKLQTPNDFFRPFLSTLWLLLSLLTWGGICWYAYAEYYDRWPLAESPAGYCSWAATMGLLYTVIIAGALMAFWPVLTPSFMRYRPRAWFVFNKTDKMALAEEAK